MKGFDKETGYEYYGNLEINDAFNIMLWVFLIISFAAGVFIGNILKFVFLIGLGLNP